MNETETATLAVVVARLDDLRGDIHSIREDMRRTAEATVTRNEWLQRNGYVDAKFDDQGRDISDLRTELAGKRVPWTAIAAVGLSAGALAWTVLGPVIIAL